MPRRHLHNTLRWYRAGEWLLARLPRRVSYAICRGFGARDVLFPTHHRRVIEGNVGAIRPDLDAAGRRALARRTIWNYCDTLCDTFFVLGVDAESAERQFVRFEGLERFLALEPGKRGLIVATAHLGGWELGGVAFASRGYPVAVVSAVDVDDEIERYRVDARKSLGIETLRIGTDPMSAVRAVEWLRSGKLLALLVDRDLGGPSIEIPFLGRRARMPSGYANLALAAGVPIVPSFVVREGAGRYRAVFEEPIFPPADSRGDRVAAVERLVRSTLGVVERALRKHADQYFVPVPIFAADAAPAEGTVRSVPA